MTKREEKSGFAGIGDVLKKKGQETLTFFGIPANTILVFFGVLLLLLNLIPLVSIVVNSFSVYDPILKANSGFTTANYTTTFNGAAKSLGFFWKPLGNSFLVSILSCVFAIVFGGGVAYLITRTNLRFKKLISTIFIFPYVMPQWTLALFWHNFFISQAVSDVGYMGELQALTGIMAPEWVNYGLFPIAMVLGLHYAPFAYILIGGLLRNMDANLEEAATILNVPKWKTFTHVTLPILKPAILSTILLVFSSAMSSYSVAATLGTPKDYYVLATQMETMINGQDSALYGVGQVSSLVLIFIGMTILLINQFSTGSRKSYTTVSGKSGQISKQNLGKVGVWVVSILLVILVLFFCVGPLVSFALESLLPNRGDFSSGLTLRWWITSDNSLKSGMNGIFYSSEIWDSLGRTLILSFTCSALAGTFGLLIGYAVARKRKSKLAGMVNGLAFLPYLLPSISMSVIFAGLTANMAGMGMTLFYTTPMMVAIILGTVKYIPFASRSSLNAMLQLSNEIEEAALIQNVPWWKRMLRVVFPIQKSSFLSGYLLPFISCMREYDLYVFIGGQSLLLTKMLFVYQSEGLLGIQNGANLVLVIIILATNLLVNKITGASLDKGIGG